MTQRRVATIGSDVQLRVIQASLLLRWAQNKNVQVRMVDETTTKKS